MISHRRRRLDRARRLWLAEAEQWDGVAYIGAMVMQNGQRVRTRLPVDEIKEHWMAATQRRIDALPEGYRWLVHKYWPQLSSSLDILEMRATVGTPAHRIRELYRLPAEDEE